VGITVITEFSGNFKLVKTNHNAGTKQAVARFQLRNAYEHDVCTQNL
jgi:hypothetical protein